MKMPSISSIGNIVEFRSCSCIPIGLLLPTNKPFTSCLWPPKMSTYNTIQNANVGNSHTVVRKHNYWPVISWNSVLHSVCSTQFVRWLTWDSMAFLKSSCPPIQHCFCFSRAINVFRILEPSMLFVAYAISSCKQPRKPTNWTACSL